MAVREQLVYTGSLVEDSPDNGAIASIALPTSKRAIQIYGVQLSFSSGLLVGAAFPSRVRAEVYMENKDGTKTQSVMAKEILLSAAGEVDLSTMWTAPPSLIFARDMIHIQMEGLATGVANVMQYWVYYKPVKVSDVQYMQLMLIP